MHHRDPEAELVKRPIVAESSPRSGAVMTLETAQVGSATELSGARFISPCRTVLSTGSNAPANNNPVAILFCKRQNQRSRDFRGP